MRPPSAYPASRPGTVLLGAVLGAVCAVGALPAQQELPPLSLALDAATGGVEVRIGDLLREGGVARSLEAGLPIRFHLVTELWREGWFDSQEGRHEWRATVRRDPLEGVVAVETAEGLVLEVGSVAEATAFLGGLPEVPLRPQGPGRYYYLARLEVETLSLSDLDELRRWLRGELAPALGQESDVGGAFGRGLRRLFVRILGLPAERVQVRTPRFDWPG